MITTEAMVGELPKKDPGDGGVGGMDFGSTFCFSATTRPRREAGLFMVLS